MTSFNSTHKFTAAAAFGAAALFSMISFGSNAEAAQSVWHCQGGTAKAVVSCCDKLTKAQRPLWMIQSRSSCKEVVVCGGLQNNERRCYVRVTYRQNDGGGDEGGGDPGRDTRSPN
ncbi:MAG: hypothetical protein Q8L53_15935 [Aestuariivirga sp.]|nr:hypothetical protein [Aestuariivirga sp.]